LPSKYKWAPFSKAAPCPDEYSTVGSPRSRFEIRDSQYESRYLALLSLMSGCVFLWLLPSSRNCCLMYDVFVLLYSVRVVGPSRPNNRWLWGRYNGFQGIRDLQAWTHTRPGTMETRQGPHDTDSVHKSQNIKGSANQIKEHSHVRSSEYGDCATVGEPKAGGTSRRPAGLDQTEGLEKPSS